jgi:hypothetical protein
MTDLSTAHQTAVTAGAAVVPANDSSGGWAEHDAAHRNLVDAKRSADDPRSVGKAPYGYTTEPYAPHDNPKKAREGYTLKRWTPHPVDRVAVALVFEMYLAGHQQTDIARALTSRGVLTPADRRQSTPSNSSWDQQAVRAILTNPRYTGFRFEKHTVDESADWVRSQAATHLALIDVSTYMEARRLTLTPKMKNRTPAVIVDPLQGRVRCGSCRRPMSRAGKSYVCQPNATGRASVAHLHATSISAKADYLFEVVLQWANAPAVSGLDRNSSPSQFNLAMRRKRIVVVCTKDSQVVETAE